MWTEKDKALVIDFLNLISDKAQFNDMSVKDNIKLYGYLSYMQNVMLKKIDDSIIEVLSVTKVKED